MYYSIHVQVRSASAGRSHTSSGKRVKRIILSALCACTLLILFPGAALMKASAPVEQTVRVRVLADRHPTTIEIEAIDGKLLVTEYGALSSMHELKPGQRARVSLHPGGVVAELPRSVIRSSRLSTLR